MDSARITLCILYLQYQNLYLEEHIEKFHILANWMLEDATLETIPNGDMYPSICSACGTTHGYTCAGHVTNGCHKCCDTVPFSERIVRYLWEPMLARILRVSECVLETYLAIAINYIVQAKEQNFQPIKELQL